DRRTGTVGYLRVVEVAKPAAGELKPELVHLRVADCPSVLHLPCDVPIGLLRGAGVCILSERLILTADLDTAHCAWTNIDAKHEPVCAAQVVIETQRVQARSLSHRK